MTLSLVCWVVQVRKFPVELFTSDRVGLVLAFWALGIHLGRPLVCRPSYPSFAIEQNLSRAVFQQRAQNDILLCALGIHLSRPPVCIGETTNRNNFQIFGRYWRDVQCSLRAFAAADRMSWCWYFSAAS